MAATGAGSDPARTERGPSGRLAALLGLAAVPWTVIPAGGTLAMVFPWGLVNAGPLAVTTIWRYLGPFTAGLPSHLQAWPASALLYATAVASAAAGRFGREDRRVTGALLVLAGAAHLLVVLGLRRGGLPAIPVGPVLLWAVAWWFHAADLRAIVGGRRR